MKLIKTLIVASILPVMMAQAADQMTFNTPDEAIKYRQESFDNIKKSVTAINKMVKSSSDWDAEAYTKLAETFAKAAEKPLAGFNSADTALGVYKGSLETAAKKEIWENQADFSNKMDAFKQATQKLLADTNDKEKVKVAFDEVRKTCGACHKLYKED